MSSRDRKRIVNWVMHTEIFPEMNFVYRRFGAFPILSASKWEMLIPNKKKIRPADTKSWRQTWQQTDIKDLKSSWQSKKKKNPKHALLELTFPWFEQSSSPCSARQRALAWLSLCRLKNNLGFRWHRALGWNMWKQFEVSDGGVQVWAPGCTKTPARGFWPWRALIKAGRSSWFSPVI